MENEQNFFASIKDGCDLTGIEDCTPENVRIALYYKPQGDLGPTFALPEKGTLFVECGKTIHS